MSNRAHNASILSRAWDAGNYANAYETTRFSSRLYPSNIRSQKARFAFMLGFFSSHELAEIPDSWRDEYEAACRWAESDPAWKLTGIGTPWNDKFCAHGHAEDEPCEDCHRY